MSAYTQAACRPCFETATINHFNLSLKKIQESQLPFVEFYYLPRCVTLSWLEDEPH